jgi:nitroimidazol reductase NimA-like FMN-containing flavoprotein (pyridoxamine 5'-phosphate oxidase superfamily)
MTQTAAPAVTVLTDAQSWDLLSSVKLGRLGTSLGGQPEIFPVNFTTDRSSILFRTAEGTKLLGAVMNNRVAFEADEHTSAGGWSVVVKGTAHVLSSQADLEAAEADSLRPWVPTVKQRYVRITVDHISGRRFLFGAEPEPGISTYSTD